MFFTRKCENDNKKKLRRYRKTLPRDENIIASLDQRRIGEVEGTHII